jgi:hypothetical protein
MITNSIEINRPPEDVFRYLDHRPARRDARKQIPKSQQRLKERLDSGA